MYCRKCGKEINNDVVFCPYCGEATTTGSASNKPLGEKKTIEKTNVSNGTNKTLIFVGVAIIVVLLAIILILVNGGKNKGNDNVDTSNVTDEKAVEDSILSEIVGEWKQCGKVGGGAYADWYETPTYLRIVPEGLMGVGAAEAFDVDTGEVVGENVFYQIGTRNINVYEENGVKYYEISAEIFTGIEGKNEIGIRYYYDNTENVLVCDYNVPEDGFWQKHAKYERIDSIQGDREDRLYADNTGSQTEGDMEQEQNSNASNDNLNLSIEELVCGAWVSQTSDECLFGLDFICDETGYGFYQKNNNQGWDITYTMDGQKIFLNIDGIETEFYYDLENDIMIRDADGEEFTRLQ